MTLCLSLVDDEFFGKSSFSSSSSSATIVDGVLKKKSNSWTDSVARRIRPFVHPYLSVAVYALFFAYVVKLFDLRVQFSASSSSSSSSSSFPFSVHSRVAFTEKEFFSTLTSTMPLTIYMGVGCFLFQVLEVASSTFALMKNVKTGNAADIAGGIVWRSGQLVQVNEKSLSMPFALYALCSLCLFSL